MINGFYNEYYGHKISDLEQLHDYIRSSKGQDSIVIWLSGDSSLDNKCYVDTFVPAVNGYDKILKSGNSKPDVAYWINKILQDNGVGGKITAINCAVEESSIGSRACGRMHPHDKFIRDHR